MKCPACDSTRINRNELGDIHCKRCGFINKSVIEGRCPHCKMKVNVREGYCLFCGEPLTDADGDKEASYIG